MSLLKERDANFEMHPAMQLTINLGCFFLALSKGFFVQYPFFVDPYPKKCS